MGEMESGDGEDPSTFILAAGAIDTQPVTVCMHDDGQDNLQTQPRFLLPLCNICHSQL